MREKPTKAGYSHFIKAWMVWGSSPGRSACSHWAKIEAKAVSVSVSVSHGLTGEQPAERRSGVPVV